MKMYFRSRSGSGADSLRSCTQAEESACSRTDLSGWQLSGGGIFDETRYIEAGNRLLPQPAFFLSSAFQEFLYWRHELFIIIYHHFPSGWRKNA
jgi:hypothetical protein